ncbi:MAG TPA: tetratricopeptide repeat protein [Longimicrobiales bacterium]
MRLFFLTAILLCTASAHAYAQTAAIPLEEALIQYEAAVAADSNAQAALVNAALAAVTIAEYQAPSAERDSLFARAVRHARRAVALNSADAQAHFALARALGRFALTQGVREQARLATEIRNEALAALAINREHAGAHHVLGLWHKTVMKLSGVQRLIARTFLGAKGMSEASWDQAVSHLERAVRSEPQVMVHRLNLGRLYVERKRWDDARQQLQWVLQAPSVDYNDENYRREAEKSLKLIPQ